MGKNPAYAALLSFIIGGLGQAYLGLWGKAAMFFALELITGYLYITYESEPLFIANLTIGAWSMVDAYANAKKTQTTKKIKPTEKQPQVKVF